jgi:hypothetical protein
MGHKKAIPEATRRAVALRYGCEPGGSTLAKCHYCPATGRITWTRLYSGKPGSWVHFELSLDHVVPESAGGSMDSENFVLACKSCNSSKRDSSVDEWLTTRSRLAHDSFSEPVRKTMSGKGREGNKEGKGRRVETSHHVVAYVTRGGATP